MAAAVKRVAPAVARIDTERSVPRIGLDPSFNDPLLRELFGDQMPSTRERGQGSGIVIDAKGLVLTNAHVVDQVDGVEVTLADGRQLDGVVVGADPVTDLAVVRLERVARAVLRLVCQVCLVCPQRLSAVAQALVAVKVGQVAAVAVALVAVAI